MLKKFVISFCGPIAKQNQAAGGGFQAANRNTINKLQEQGIDILELPYPEPNGCVAKKIIIYIMSFLKIYFMFFSKRKSFNLIHFTPLYKGFIYLELLIVIIAKIIRRPILIDLRAGQLIGHYKTRSLLYKFIFKTAVRLSNDVSVEGFEYIPFIHSFSKHNALYFPNYVQEVVPGKRRRQIGINIKLVFLGRIVPEKGIEVALQTTKTLNNKLNSCKLIVIGADSTKYCENLRKRHSKDYVQWLGKVSHDKINKLIRSCHFFIFPTTHFGEGHSNALTEAMAEGLVPICSDNGFNKKIVSNAGIILPSDATSDDYVTSIIEIIEKDRWKSISRAAQERIGTNFTADAVIPELINKYEELIR